MLKHTIAILVAVRMIILTEIIVVCNFTYTQFSAHGGFFCNWEKILNNLKFFRTQVIKN